MITADSTTLERLGGKVVRSFKGCNTVHPRHIHRLPVRPYVNQGKICSHITSHCRPRLSLISQCDHRRRQQLTWIPQSSPTGS